LNSRGLCSCEASPFVVDARILARETAGSYYAPRLRNLQGLSFRKSISKSEQSGDKMKTAKATCATLFLALSFSVPVYADNGEVHTPGRPQASCTSEPANSNAGGPCTPTTGDSSFADFLDILQAVSSLL
jgi:hypothetical protein